MEGLANSPVTAPVLDAILGYRRVYDRLADAAAAVVPHADGGHVHPVNVKVQMSRSVTPRPSDYAALFHLRGLAFEGAKIFDFGGSVGHLFYLYDRYLHFPRDCVWQVFDLPPIVEQGRMIAASRGEDRLQFMLGWEAASGAYLFIASGALHYFDTPLFDIIAKLSKKPEYLLVNRTPLIDGPQKATVQDSTGTRVACVLYNRAELVAGLEAIGYKVVDSWKAWESSLKLVGRPQYSAVPYSGYFFRLNGAAPKQES